MFDSKEVVISIDGQVITGKKCAVQSMQINMQNDVEPIHTIGSRKSKLFMRGPSIHEITFTLLCTEMHQEYWTEGFKPKLRNKKVDDCTIQELLYAVRQKNKREMKMDQEELKTKIALQNAELTMMILLGKDQKGLNIITDNSCLRIEENEKDTIVTIYKDVAKQIKKFEKDEIMSLTKNSNFIADWGNDPTSSRAGDQASLGYYLLRLWSSKVEIKNKAPLVIVSKTADFDSKLVRPQRPLYAPPMHGLDIDLNDHPIDKDTASVIKDYIIPKNTWDITYMAVYAECKKNKQSFMLLSELDLRSFHCIGTIVDFKALDIKDSEKKRKKLYEEFLKKHIKHLKREENYNNLRGV